MTPRLGIPIALVVLAPLAACPARAEAPPVAVSIAPLQGLVAGVMEGVGEPTLIQRAGSPHGYTLRPSDARALAEARVVFLVDPRFETFLARPLGARSDGVRIVALAAAPGVKTVPARRGGTWEESDHDHEHHPDRDAKRDADTGPPDWHLWLAPANARAVVAHAARVLSEADPDNAKRYAANAERMRRRIETLEAELGKRLAPVRRVPYIVFHDAYRYFEDAFGLSPAGAATVSPERPPGIRRVRAIRATIAARRARCVFAEPQFEPALVRTLIEDTGARAGTLDPLGAAIAPGPDSWFALMRGLADALETCLSGGNAR